MFDSGDVFSLSNGAAFNTQIHLFTDKLGNIVFIIEGDSSAIMKAILRSLSVIYGSIWKQVMEIYR